MNTIPQNEQGFLPPAFGEAMNQARIESLERRIQAYKDMVAVLLDTIETYKSLLRKDVV